MIQTTPVQLQKLWQDLGIEEGMVVYCHSFLASLGQIKPNPNVVIDTLLTQLGKSGTFVVPTYTWSYFRGELYDVQESESKIGILGNMVKKRPESIRSLDPNFSMAAIGSSAEYLLKRETPFSFGLGSIYEKLLYMDTIILLLGVDYTSLSMFMHFEKTASVNYRYDKIFEGKTKDGDKIYQDKGIHYVRDLDIDPVCDRNRIGAIIDQEPDCKIVSFAYGIHRLIPARTIAGIVAENLIIDPYCLIKVNGKLKRKKDEKAIF